MPSRPSYPSTATQTRLNFQMFAFLVQRHCMPVTDKKCQRIIYAQLYGKQIQVIQVENQIKIDFNILNQQTTIINILFNSL